MLNNTQNAALILPAQGVIAQLVLSLTHCLIIHVLLHGMVALANDRG